MREKIEILFFPIFNFTITPKLLFFDMFCSMCFNANRPEYNTHFLRASKDPKSPVTCPFLNNIQCKLCNLTGHTKSYCPSMKNRFSFPALDKSIASVDSDGWTTVAANNKKNIINNDDNNNNNNNDNNNNNNNNNNNSINSNNSNTNSSKSSKKKKIKKKNLVSQTPFKKLINIFILMLIANIVITLILAAAV